MPIPCCSAPGLAGEHAAVGSCGRFSGLPKGTAKPSETPGLPALFCMRSTYSTARRWAPYRRFCSGVGAFTVAACGRSPPPLGEYAGCPAPRVLDRHGAAFKTEPLGATCFLARLWAYIFSSSLKGHSANTHVSNFSRTRNPAEPCKVRT